jgi:hypothetical protein
MKTLSCDQCSDEFSDETFDGWAKQIQAHYIAAHMDYMMKNASASPSEIAQWFADAKARFDAA